MKRSLLRMGEVILVVACCAVTASIGKTEDSQRHIFISSLICAVLAECIANRREEGSGS